MPIEDVQLKKYLDPYLNPYQKLNYYFSNDINKDTINEASIFIQTYRQLKKQVDQELPDVSKKSYKTHILLVGFSIEPILLSILALEANNIILIFTTDSRTSCGQIAQWVKLVKQFLNFSGKLEFINRDDWKAKSPFEVLGSDPASTFHVINNIIEQQINNGILIKEIALDVTGGKKTMVSGAFTAAAVIGIKTFYVDYEIYEEYGPRPGTEFLKLLTNPYEIFSEKEFVEVEKLFDSYNFEAANIILEQIKKKCYSYKSYTMDKNLQKVNRLLIYSQIYKFWDNFDYKKAFECSDNSNHVNILKILQKEKKIEHVFKDPEFMIHFAADRFLNADRRRCLNNYNYAIVLYTQVIEFLCWCKIYELVENNKIENIYKRSGLTQLLNILFGNSYLKAKDFYPVQNTELQKDLIEYLRNRFMHRFLDLQSNEFLSCSENIKEEVRKINIEIDYLISIDNTFSTSDFDQSVDILRVFSFLFLKNFHLEYWKEDKTQLVEILSAHCFRSFKNI